MTLFKVHKKTKTHLMKSIKNTGFNQKTSKSHKFSSQITSFKHKTNETETKY